MSDHAKRCNSTVDSERAHCPLVFASDEAYAMPLATALRSAVEANRSGRLLEVHVLSDGFSEKSRGKVFDSLPKGSVSIRWLDLDLTLFAEFWTQPYVSKMTYARLLIPRIFPDSVARVLYLDSDVLVLDDLGSLWDTDLEGAVVGAALDGLDAKLRQRDPSLEEVPRVRDYFNAGVLLIDLDRWRKERISEKAVEYLDRHPRSPYMDQDALNVACDGLWKRLDSRWNFQDHYHNKISDTAPERRPAIIHFVWELKPWNATTHSLNADLYDAFRSRTCFARTSRDKLRDLLEGVLSRVKCHLRRYTLLRAICTSLRVKAVRRCTPN